MFEEWNEKMFGNAGGKIKTIAKVLVWIQIITGLVVAVLLLIAGLLSLAEGGWVSLILAPIFFGLNCVFAWLSVIMLYAFGELLDKVDDTDRKLGIIVRLVDGLTKGEGKAPKQKPASVEEKVSTAEKPPVSEPVIGAEQAPAAKKNPISTPTPVGPEKNASLAERLGFALRYSTDEGMIHYLQGIDDAKVQEILAQPKEMIRQLVEKTIQELQGEA